MDDKYRAVFKEEAQELLAELETALLELEENPGDMEIVGRVFRAMHTIKGSGAMFGFDAISSFTHKMETLFDQVRNGKLAVTPPLISLVLAGRDQILAMLSEEEPPPEAVTRRNAEIVADLQALSEGGGAAKPSEAAKPSGLEPPRQRTYRVRFQPGPAALEGGCDPAALIRELSALGSARAVAVTDAVPPLDELAPTRCYVQWDIVLTTRSPESAIRDVFIFLDAESKYSVDVVDDEHAPPEDKKLGEILLDRGDIGHEELQDAVSSHKRLGDLLIERGLVTQNQVASALVEQQVVRENRSQREAASSVRVPADKLDYLVDMVGELVIVQARLTQTSLEKADPALVSIAEELERLTADLRDSTLNIRMVPIGTTFSRFRRLVRDLSGELGKEADLETEGAETELDKTVIEQLGDPLVHLIRNSVDHGIESPEGREAAGKPRRGVVRLSAAQAGGDVLIRIQDDGKGLDVAKIRAKAVERGLIAADANPSEQEIFACIFQAGFSTAETVSSVSGRGVGMDVVRRSIDALRGTVTVESKKGAGTVITIRLPLTLAIIEGLLVRVSGDSYVMPLQAVEECVELSREDVRNAHGHRLAKVRGDLVPYLRLRDWFLVEGECPDIEQIVVTNVEGIRFGFVVDKVVGQHQTVIKNLGAFYRDIEGLSGATILGDGTVALILDAQGLMRAVMAQG